MASICVVEVSECRFGERKLYKTFKGLRLLAGK